MDLQIPSNHVLCQNSECRNAKDCLRQLAYEQALERRQELFHVLNPTVFPENDSSCSKFKAAEKLTFAWGIKNILENIPYQNAISIKRDLISHFGRAKYYRFYRKERAISPDEQNQIKRIFKQNGVEEDIQFESYTEEFEWSF